MIWGNSQGPFRASRSYAVLSLYLSALTLIPQPAFSANSSSNKKPKGPPHAIHVPCDAQQVNPGERRNCEVYRGKDGTSGISKEVFDRISKKIECFYRGKDIDLFRGSQNGTPPAGTKPDFCDAFESRPSAIRPCNLAKLDANKNPIEAVEPSSAYFTPFNQKPYQCGNPLVLTDKNVFQYGDGPKLETAYTSGAMIQALETCALQVKDEIANEGYFDASSLPQSFHDGYGGPLQTLSAVDDRLGAAEALAESKISCTTMMDMTLDPNGGKPQPRIAACYLAAAKSNIDELFRQLAVLEILERWKLLWENGAPKLRDFMQAHIEQCQDLALELTEMNPDGTVKQASYQEKFNNCYRNGHEPNAEKLKSAGKADSSLVVTGSSRMNTRIPSLVAVYREATLQLFGPGKCKDIAALASTQTSPAPASSDTSQPKALALEGSKLTRADFDEEYKRLKKETGCAPIPSDLCFKLSTYELQYSCLSPGYWSGDGFLNLDGKSTQEDTRAAHRCLKHEPGSATYSDTNYPADGSGKRPKDLLPGQQPGDSQATEWRLASNRLIPLFDCSKIQEGDTRARCEADKDYAKWAHDHNNGRFQHEGDGTDWISVKNFFHRMGAWAWDNKEPAVPPPLGAVKATPAKINCMSPDLIPYEGPMAQLCCDPGDQSRTNPNPPATCRQPTTGFSPGGHVSPPAIAHDADKYTKMAKALESGAPVPSMGPLANTVQNAATAGGTIGPKSGLDSTGPRPASPVAGKYRRDVASNGSQNAVGSLNNGLGSTSGGSGSLDQGAETGPTVFTGEGETGAGYSSAGGSVSGAGGNGGSGFSGFGDYGAAAATGTNPESMEFGATGEPAVMQDADPLDYFARTDLDENIFKVVEKRYRTKNENWIKSELDRQSTR